MVGYDLTCGSIPLCKYLSSAIVVAVGRPWVNLLAAESVIKNFAKVYKVRRTPSYQFGHFCLNLSSPSSFDSSPSQFFRGKFLEFIVTNWPSLISYFSITATFADLISSMHIYASRRWDIPIAVALICILHFYSAIVIWQCIQMLYDLAYFEANYHYSWNFTLIFENQCILNIIKN